MGTVKRDGDSEKGLQDQEPKHPSTTTRDQLPEASLALTTHISRVYIIKKIEIKKERESSDHVGFSSSLVPTIYFY